ncbi:MAG TPA: flagellin [Bdellovibrionales bacterium]|nr:flagellin [Bdellovibrionales bacterium]
MPLRINTNVASIAAQRHLDKSDRRMEHALKALASGNRIVQAGDDAAGLAISENLRGQLAGLRQARFNSENAISLIQVAEGGLNEQNNILIRLRELGIQAASDNVSDVERGYLNQEFGLLIQEFDRIAKTTAFGNKRLLEGTGERFEFQVGHQAGPENVIEYQLDADSTAGTIGISGLAVEDQDEARSTLEEIDAGLDKLAAIRASFGAIQSRLLMTTSNLDIQYENVSAARSRMADADIAYETAELTAARVTQDAGIAALTQANTLPSRANMLIHGVT